MQRATRATASLPAWAPLVHQTIFLRMRIRGEGVMHRQWRVHRHVLAVPDGQRRWDQAYLQLLSWGTSEALTPATAVRGRQRQEVNDASSDLCAGIDAATGAGADD